MKSLLLLKPKKHYHFIHFATVLYNLTTYLHTFWEDIHVFYTQILEQSSRKSYRENILLRENPTDANPTRNY